MKTKLPLAVAQEIANHLVHLLSPACERIEIAGSIRRKKAQVGDIEIVCIPKRQANLFGDSGASLLEPFLVSLKEEGLLTQGDKNGDKYKEFFLPGQPIKLDLFITTPEQWGLIFTIRTGPEEFSHRLVTVRQHGGYLPSNLKVADGWIWDGKTAIATPEEVDVFELIGLKWVDPEKR